MSGRFADKVRRQLKVSHPEASAVLVRYQGFTGMLVRKDESGNGSQVQFHESMQKFTISDEAVRRSLSFICIVDYSRSGPQAAAYLNEKLIMFLVARGVSAEYLKKLQSHYYDLLNGMCRRRTAAGYFLRVTGRSINRAEYSNQDVESLQKNEIMKMIDAVTSAEQEAPTRVRILVSMAREVFGVCDPYGALQYGECYYEPTLLNDERNEFESKSSVVVAPSSCYHPGDIRVLKLRHASEMPDKYQLLKDCLVMPVKGRRPHAFECAGGDLGGRKFFVCWDEKLIPKKDIKPFSYSPTKFEKLSDATAKLISSVSSQFHRSSRKSKADETREEMIDYFASFTDDLPCQIDKTYMKHAKVSGLLSNDCEKLSKMLYQVAESTVSTDVLRNRLSEIEEMGPEIDSSQCYKSTTERSDLLSSEARSNHHSSFLKWISRLLFRDPLVITDDLREFEEQAKSFVQQAQEEALIP